MKIVTTLIIGASMLALAACGTTPTGAPTVFGITVSSVQALAVKACSFQPTADTVLGILAAGNPLLTTAEAVATAICSAVTSASPAAAGRGAPAPEVSGVLIKGRFIR